MKPIPFSLRLSAYLAVSFLLTAWAGAVFHSSVPLTALAALFLAALCGGPLVLALTRMREALARLNSGAAAEPLPTGFLGPLAQLAAEVNVLLARAGDAETLREGWLAQARAGAAQEERNRLARDLHDSIKQQLFSIHVSTAAAQARWENDPPGAQAALADVRQNAQEALTEMNALLAQLSPAPLEKVGLVQALREQCEALAYRTGAVVTPVFGTLPADDRWPPGAQESLFRIAQEALSNIARHARAKSVKLYLGQAEVSGKLRLVIEDDGQGFEAKAQSNGMGLANIRERVGALGGQLDVRSTAGQGTALGLDIPLTTLPVTSGFEFFQPDHRLNKIFAVGIAAGLALMALLVYPLHIALPGWFTADFAPSNPAWTLALEVLAALLLVGTGFVATRGAQVASRALGMGAGALAGLTAALVMFFAIGGSAAGVVGHAELLRHGLRAASVAEVNLLPYHVLRDTLLWTQGAFWLTALAGAGLGALGGAFAPLRADSSSDKSWLRLSGVLMLVPLAFVSALAAFVAVAVFTGLESELTQSLLFDGLAAEHDARLMLALAAPVFSPLLLFAFASLGLHQLYRAELQLPLTTELNRARVMSALDESVSHAALAATLPLLLFWLMWATLQGFVSGVLVGLVSGSVLCYIVAGLLFALNWRGRQRARAAGMNVPAWGWLTGALGIVVVLGMFPAGGALFELLNWPMSPNRSAAFMMVAGEMVLGVWLLNRLRVQSLTEAARRLRPLAAARAVSGLLGVIVAFTIGGMLLIPPAQSIVSLLTRMMVALTGGASSVTLRQILIDHYLIGAQVFLLIAIVVAALVSVSILIYWGLTPKKVSGE